MAAQVSSGRLSAGAPTFRTFRAPSSRGLMATVEVLPVAVTAVVETMAVAATVEFTAVAATVAVMPVALTAVETMAAVATVEVMPPVAVMAVVEAMAAATVAVTAVATVVEAMADVATVEVMPVAVATEKAREMEDRDGHEMEIYPTNDEIAFGAGLEVRKHLKQLNEPAVKR